MTTRKIVAGLVGSLAMLVFVMLPGVSAQAQPLPGSSAAIDRFQAPQFPDFNQLVQQFDQGNRDGAWHLRTQLVHQANTLNPQFAAGLAQTIDQALEFVFPGLIAQKQQAARGPAEPMTPAPARGPQIDTGACPADARVCVDIDGRRTWLQDGHGSVTHVASAMAPGKPGQDTPRGTFHVNRKVKDEISYEFNNAPMPYAIYFTNNGHAFHEGSPAYDSAGCVRLPNQDAITFWNHLNIGDKVFIY